MKTNRVNVLCQVSAAQKFQYMAKVLGDMKERVRADSEKRIRQAEQLTEELKATLIAKEQADEKVKEAREEAAALRKQASSKHPCRSP